MVFSVSNCDEDYAQKIGQLLPHCNDTVGDDDHVYDARMGCINDVRELFNHILKKHKGCLWIDAACVVSPQGHKILISGDSHAGKSTISMALAFAYDWKVMAEDIALLDGDKLEIINYASPFSMKEGTLSLLRDTFKVDPQPIVLDEWVPMGARNFGHDLTGPFDFVIQLKPFSFSEALDCQPISSSEYLRSVLNTSNVLRLKNGTENFMEFLREGTVFRISGGSTRERIEKIQALCQSKKGG